MGKVHEDLTGHNGGVTESTFFHHMKEREKLESQLATLKGKMSQQKAKEKDDGLDPADITWALKYRNRPVAEQIALHNRRLTFMRYLKLPMGTQMEFVDPNFSDDTGMTDEQRQEKWENHGYVGGRAGESLDKVMEGHDPNSISGRFIAEGWRRGQAENGGGIKAGKGEGAKGTPKAVPKAVPKGAPKDEPEVAAAKAKAKEKGLTYWHDAEKRKVYEISSADANPEGAKSITRDEYEKLKADYAAADENDWEKAGESAAPKPTDDEAPKPDADDDFGDVPETGTKH